MRGLLAFSCRAFPRDHRARQSDEIVDTAVLAAEGSTWRATCEAFSLVVAGMRQRLRVETHRSPRDGVALLARFLAVMNLAVALAGISLSVDPPRIGILVPVLFFFRNPYLVRGWWIAFSLAAATIVLGLVLGNRRLALGAALANLGIVAYEAFYFRPLLRGHLNAFAYEWKGFPLGREWLAPAVVLVLATAGAPLRRLPLWRLAPALAAAVVLVVVSRQILDGYFFLLWPFAAIVALALVFGWHSPRLAVVAVGVSLVAAPSVVASLANTSSYRAPVFWMAALTFAVAFLLPLAYLTRRRLT
jgi:hypothetical protein